MKVIVALVLGWLCYANTVLSNENHALDKAPINPSDYASLQRGAHTFINYCLNCHSANYMRYNRLQSIGLTPQQIKDNLLFTSDKLGSTMQVALKKSDAKKWFGAEPPDLSVEVRVRGVDWLYTYMRSFYRDETRPTGWNNTLFDKVAMPHVLYELQGLQVLKDGKLNLVQSGSLNVQAYDRLVADLTNYLAFMAEPAKANREKIGWWVLIFLSMFCWLTYRLKCAYWKDIK